MFKTPWIANARFDLLWIIGPHFFSVALIYFWSQSSAGSGNVSALPLWAWLVGVLFVDVAHVYATLFRTYLHREGREKWAFLLLALPLGVFMGGFFLYKAFGALIYWRVLAYVAAFHFVRQQYGFYKIYVRKDRTPRAKKIIDEFFLYSLMLLPLLYWHTHLPRDFEWFVLGDFMPLPEQVWAWACGIAALIGVTYVTSEIFFVARDRVCNLPKNLLFLATGFSWMMGIVYFNGDFAFTLTNTLSHGIPYMALVLWTSRGEVLRSKKKLTAQSFVLAAMLALLFLWTLAYVEEGLWDQFVWHERELLFRPFSFLSSLGEELGITFWVAFLSVPQVTHYLLDGFIWKLRDPTRDLAATLKT